MNQYSVSDFPPVIEPTVDVLEREHTTDLQHWTRLRRVPTCDVAALVMLPEGLCHFFGLSVDISANHFMLGYTQEGRLAATLQRIGPLWKLTAVAVEDTSDLLPLPSVRLVFKTERARAGFLYYIRQVVVGKVISPSLQLVLDQLEEPPAVIGTWRPPDA